jgi:hypothetical protein
MGSSCNFIVDSYCTNKCQLAQRCQFAIAPSSYVLGRGYIEGRENLHESCICQLRSVTMARMEKQV